MTRDDDARCAAQAEETLMAVEHRQVVRHVARPKSRRLARSRLMVQKHGVFTRCTTSSTEPCIRCAKSPSVAGRAR